MKKIAGILTLFLVICIVTTIMNRNFVSGYNMQNTLKWSALYGIIGVGVAFVIIGGGIDLSIGSVVGLIGVLLGWMLTVHSVPVPLALLICLVVSAGIGLAHGLIITKVGLQPFVVTLCGLLLYRGIARFIMDDESVGFGTDKFQTLSQAAKGAIPITESFGVPLPVLYIVILGVIAAVLLNRTIFGRYLLALGRNETAARYSGIKTDRIVIATYVWCSTLAGFGGVLFSLELNSIQPASMGEFYELYAIAAAVLGGCSLRGGEGTIVGVIIGAAVMRVLYNSINLLGISPTLEFVIIGTVLLAGVTTDELVKRFAARKKAAA